MKVVYWLVGISFSIMLALFILLFTPLGNSIVKPILENKIQEETKLQSRLEVFSLNLSSFEFHLLLNEHNSILVKGNYSFTSQSIDTIYDINFEEFITLQEWTQMEIDTPLHLSGTIQGDKSSIELKGISDIASSKTNFIVNIIDFEPSSITAAIKGMKIEELLSITKQGHYGDGFVDLDINIHNLGAKSLEGSIDTTIYDTTLDSKYITKQFGFTSLLPLTKMNVKTETQINKNIITTKLNLDSTLLDLDVNKAVVDMDNKSLNSDYKVNLHNLDKFYFITQRALKGSLIADGVIKKAKSLDATLHSIIAGGKIDAILHNDDLVATATSLETLEVLDMLYYPKIFKADINGQLDYNLKEASGVFEGKLSNGKFTKNEVLDLTKEYANIDMYKERFKGDIDAAINQENIKSSITLNSNLSSIKTKDALLNTKTNIVKSRVDINTSGNLIEVTLTGDINSPSVEIQADELIKKEATKIITKEINKFLESFF